MSVQLSGPMFEPSKTAIWESCFKKNGAHYNIFQTTRSVREVGMSGLRQVFPTGEADEMNFCLFSTSGVHGTYGTIEDAEAMLARGNKYEDGTEGRAEVTFLIVHPRIVCLRYGNCYPETCGDIEFLKKVRKSSLGAVLRIGSSERGLPDESMVTSSSPETPPASPAAPPSHPDKSFSAPGSNSV